MKIVPFPAALWLTLALSLSFSPVALAQLPADVIDLRFWKLTLPLDGDGDGKVDEIGVSELARYSHPDFFFVDANGWLVFTAPNQAATTANSSNTRSELRQMLRGSNTRIGTHDPMNNFALKAHRKAKEFADIGGQLEATLRVVHAPVRAKYPEKRSAYSVVVGQIHALKDQKEMARGEGFGWGNEPLKIFYKKWPDHETGSVFWTYERNLAREDPDREDIAHSVWGNTWENPVDPGSNGITLGEIFNYNVNVYENTMYLTFRTRDPARTVTHQLDLSTGIDDKDNPLGYTDDAMYFKAGAYNQCNTRDAPSSNFPGCAGTGDWQTDKANGDYASVAFRRIQLTRAVKP